MTDKDKLIAELVEENLRGLFDTGHRSRYSEGASDMWDCIHLHRQKEIDDLRSRIKELEEYKFMYEGLEK